MMSSHRPLTLTLSPLRGARANSGRESSAAYQATRSPSPRESGERVGVRGPL
jgi:hypothetical protein